MEFLRFMVGGRAIPVWASVNKINTDRGYDTSEIHIRYADGKYTCWRMYADHTERVKVCESSTLAGAIQGAYE